MTARTINGAAMARIVAAEIFEIEAAYSKPYKLSWGTLTTTRAIILKLIDADGVIGWGEANPHQPFTVESPREAADGWNRLRTSYAKRFLYAHIDDKRIAQLATDLAGSRPGMTTQGFGPKKFAKTTIRRKLSKSG